MNKTLTLEERVNLVRYRMESAENTLAEVRVHRENGFYNTAVNRLYYACYYAATAILIANGIEVKSHDGVRMNLGKHIFNHTRETLDELMHNAKLFIQVIREWTNNWLKDIR